MDMCDDRESYVSYITSSMIYLRVIWYSGYSFGHLKMSITPFMRCAMYVMDSEVYNLDLRDTFNNACHQVICPPPRHERTSCYLSTVSPSAIGTTTVEVMQYDLLQECISSDSYYYPVSKITANIRASFVTNWPMGGIEIIGMQENVNNLKKYTFDYLQALDIVLWMSCSKSMKGMGLVIKISECMDLCEQRVVGSLPALSSRCDRAYMMDPYLHVYRFFIFKPRIHLIVQQLSAWTTCRVQRSVDNTRIPC